MANLDFYALHDDQRDLLRFIFAETDIVIYELASEFDRDARKFISLADVESVFELGGPKSILLQLWSRSVLVRPIIRRIDLEVPGYSFRYAVEGMGLIQLYLEGRRDGVIYHSHYGHFNEAGARARFTHLADDCDWKALAKLSGLVQRHIRRKLAVAKLFARPVLQQAYAAVEQGHALSFGPDVHRADSPDINRLGA